MKEKSKVDIMIETVAGRVDSTCEEMLMIVRNGRRSSSLDLRGGVDDY